MFTYKEVLERVGQLPITDTGKFDFTSIPNDMQWLFKKTQRLFLLLQAETGVDVPKWHSSLGRSRKRNIVEVRRLGSVLTLDLFSSSEISKKLTGYLNGVDHSTVIHHQIQHADLMDTDAEYADFVFKIRDKSEIGSLGPNLASDVATPTKPGLQEVSRLEVLSLMQFTLKCVGKAEESSNVSHILNKYYESNV